MLTYNNRYANIQFPDKYFSWELFFVLVSFFNLSPFNNILLVNWFLFSNKFIIFYNNNLLRPMGPGV